MVPDFTLSTLVLIALTGILVGWRIEWQGKVAPEPVAAFLDGAMPNVVLTLRVRMLGAMQLVF